MLACAARERACATRLKIARARGEDHERAVFTVECACRVEQRRARALIMMRCDALRSYVYASLFYLRADSSNHYHARLCCHAAVTLSVSLLCCCFSLRHYAAIRAAMPMRHAVTLATPSSLRHSPSLTPTVIDCFIDCRHFTPCFSAYEYPPHHCHCRRLATPATHDHHRLLPPLLPDI